MNQNEREKIVHDMLALSNSAMNLNVCLSVLWYGFLNFELDKEAGISYFKHASTYFDDVQADFNALQAKIIKLNTYVKY